MSVRNAAYGVFHPSWLAAGIAVGIGIQLLGWATNLGLLAGLPSYFLMGVLIGWLSPGDTILEPGVAAFVIATAGFVIDHLLLSVLGVGFVVGVLYGLVGLVLGVAGGWIGEQL